MPTDSSTFPLRSSYSHLWKRGYFLGISCGNRIYHHACKREYRIGPWGNFVMKLIVADIHELNARARFTLYWGKEGNKGKERKENRRLTHCTNLKVLKHNRVIWKFDISFKSTVRESSSDLVISGPERQKMLKSTVAKTFRYSALCIWRSQGPQKSISRTPTHERYWTIFPNCTADWHFYLNSTSGIVASSDHRPFYVGTSAWVSLSAGIVLKNYNASFRIGFRIVSSSSSRILHSNFTITRNFIRVHPSYYDFHITLYHVRVKYLRVAAIRH